MKLEEYHNFDEKKEFFDSSIINSKSDLLQLISQYEYDDNIFRGVNEAKFKIFTSAQRHWITKSLNYHYININEFINKELENLKQEKLITNYYKSLDIQINDLLYLSLLQHYDGASLFLDFSYDFKTSLFFAVDKITENMSSNIIDDYVSIYCIKDIKRIKQFFGFSFFLQNSLKQGEIILNNITENNENIKKDYLTMINKVINYDNFISKVKFKYMDNEECSEKIRTPILKQLFTLNNLNIIAQHGCFLFYNNDIIPFEKFFFQQTGYKIKCFNIHKSLANFIKKEILKDINKDSIYPSFKNIVQNTFNKTISELNL